MIKRSTSPWMKRDHRPGCWSLRTSSQTIDSFCLCVSFSQKVQAKRILSCTIPAIWKRLGLNGKQSLWLRPFSSPGATCQKTPALNGTFRDRWWYAVVLRQLWGASFAGFGKWRQQRHEFLWCAARGVRLGTGNAFRGQMGLCGRRTPPISPLKASSFISLSSRSRCFASVAGRQSNPWPIDLLLGRKAWVDVRVAVLEMLPQHLFFGLNLKLFSHYNHASIYFLSSASLIGLLR